MSRKMQVINCEIVYTPIINILDEECNIIKSDGIIGAHRILLTSLPKYLQDLITKFIKSQYKL